MFSYVEGRSIEMRSRMFVVSKGLVLIGIALFGTVESSGLQKSISENSAVKNTATAESEVNPVVQQPPADYLDSVKPYSSSQGLYGNDKDQEEGEKLKKAESTNVGDYGPLPYDHESEIDQFEVGYGGTYYRKGEGQAGSSSDLHHNHQSSFDKPLETYDPHFGSSNLNLASLSTAQLRAHLAALQAEVAAGPHLPLKTPHSAVDPLYGHGHGLSTGGLGKVNLQLADHIAHNLGKLHGLGLLQNSIKALGFEYSSHKPHIGYNPLLGKLEAVDAHLQGKLEAKDVKLEQLEHEKHALIVEAGRAALTSVQEKERLAHEFKHILAHQKLNKLNPHANLAPLYGKFEAIDAQLQDKLQHKDVRLQQLEKQKIALVDAAGKAALGSIQEKGKIAHDFHHHLAQNAALNAQLKLNLSPLLHGKLEAADAHLDAKLHDKDVRLHQLEKERQVLIDAAGKAALIAAQEKEKLGNIYQHQQHHLRHLTHGHHSANPLPLLGKYEAVDAHLATKLNEKEKHLYHLDKERQALIDAAGKAALGTARHKENLANTYGQFINGAAVGELNRNHGYGLGPSSYNPSFAPLDPVHVPLSPAAPLPVGPGSGYSYGTGEPLVPLYDKPLPLKELHKIVVKEQLNGRHYYGPGPGPNFDLYSGQAVVKHNPHHLGGEIFQEHKVSIDPHNAHAYSVKLAPYHHLHNGHGHGHFGPHYGTGSYLLNTAGAVQNAIKGTTKAIVGAALSGFGGY